MKMKRREKEREREIANSNNTEEIMLFRFSYAAKVALIYDTAPCSMHDELHKDLLVDLFVARVSLNASLTRRAGWKGCSKLEYFIKPTMIADFCDYLGKLVRDNYRLYWRRSRICGEVGGEPIDDRERRNSSGFRSNDRPARRSFLACMIRRGL